MGDMLVSPGDTPLTAGEQEHFLAHTVAMHATRGAPPPAGSWPRFRADHRVLPHKRHIPAPYRPWPTMAPSTTGAGWGTRAVYATWQMRGAGRVCYCRWSERDPLAAVDAESRSHGEGATPQRMRVSPHSPALLTPTFAWPPRLRGATGGTGHDGWCRAPVFCVRRATGSRC